jgi:hypothetical protein
MWFSTSLFVFLFHHSWCSCVFWWIRKWVSIFMFFVLIFTCERNSSARQTNSSLWCKIVWEWIYYEGPGFSLTQDSVVCLHWSEGLQSELWIGSSPLESCIEKWCDKFCSMWRSRKGIKLKCGHFKTVMFCLMDSDLERNLLMRNLQSKLSLCLFPSKSDARFMEACEST